jgi:transposase-like protein
MESEGDHAGRLRRLAPGRRQLKAAGTLPSRVRVRSCKYLNNVVEQDQQRMRPMLGFQAIRDSGGHDPRHRVDKEN